MMPSWLTSRRSLYSPVGFWTVVRGRVGRESISSGSSGTWTGRPGPSPSSTAGSFSVSFFSLLLPSLAFVSDVVFRPRNSIASSIKPAVSSSILSEDFAASMCAMDDGLLYHPATDAPATQPVMQLITNAELLSLRPTLFAAIRSEENDRLMPAWKTNDAHLGLLLLLLRATPNCCRPMKETVELLRLAVRLWPLDLHPRVEAAAVPLAAAIMVNETILSFVCV
mmetsp:Transcript_14882/g.32313  ORF Transcript_14882/g.32313 Transcript_14882/m.32313 type:complete len:224 (-) Transcript_14882:18-689(-)